MSRSIGLALPIPDKKDSSDLNNLLRVEGQKISEYSRQIAKVPDSGLVTCHFLLHST